jgi:hypothetical protein
MSHRSSFMRKALVTTAVVTGAGLGAAGIASAATSSSTAGHSGSTATTPPAAHGAPPSGAGFNPATVAHGPDETLLTGTALQKAEAAARAAVPGATVIRAETDSSGASKYEVHMKKADGTYVTVELDSKFTAVKTISGFGAGPGGTRPPAGAGGQPPAGGSAPPRAA